MSENAESDRRSKDQVAPGCEAATEMTAKAQFERRSGNQVAPGNEAAIEMTAKAGLADAGLAAAANP